MKNNLGFGARNAEARNLDSVNANIGNNYFNLPVTVTADDFVSLDESLLTAPRQADGSLPSIDFMRLAAGSDLVDKGVDLKFPFKGAAPDLGCFESGRP